MGPQVIYAKNELIVEEYYAKELHFKTRILSRDELVNLGVVLAKKIQTMVDHNFGHYENYHEHTFIIGDGAKIDIRFVDWSRIHPFYINFELEPFYIKPFFSFALQLLKSNKEAILLFRDTLLKLSGNDRQIIYNKILEDLAIF